MQFNKLFSKLWTLPFIGCTVIPTSMNDKRLATYVPKIIPPNFDPYQTPIAKKYEQELMAQPDTSGASLIEDGLSAFVIRAALARMATKTIDLQTYIYNNDLPSRVLIDELKNAADRGVKVRILIDDYGTNSNIADVILLNQHPNIEVKIFNALGNRARLLYYPQMLLDFNRLNSRMHNKLFIIDNIALVTGGRNIGSDYFIPETTSTFSDTDVLFLGAITKSATKSFNEYWNYHLAIPASVIPKACSKRALQRMECQFQKIMKARAENTRRYNKIISMAIHEYEHKNFDFCWGHGQFIADPAAKVGMSKIKKKNYHGNIILALNKLWRNTRSCAYVSAAYFVPGPGGVKTILGEEKSGVRVTIVTNSLASTNAPSVYAKWEKYRKQLIRGGAQVYEFMQSAENRRNKRRHFGHKTFHFSVMHSKTIVFDNQISWIGSFNLDPRSAYYNTENVVIFESPEFAKKLRDMILDDAKSSWHVTLNDKNVVWTGFRHGDTAPRIYKHSPDTTIFRRIFKIMTKIIPEKFV